MEVEWIERGGVGWRAWMPADARAPIRSPGQLRWLLSSRMLIGIYLGQYCITTLTWVFLTWFPIYLSQSRRPSIVTVGFLAAVPALRGFAGGILGGVASDRLLKAGHSLTFACKAPIVAGMLLAMTMIACNYVNSSLAVMLLMSLAFFGKGFSGLGWTVISDTSPKSLVSANGGLFNLIGNPAGITTPIIIRVIIEHTETFHYAFLYVAATALSAIVAYLPIVGEIRCLESPRDLIAGSNA